MIPSIDDLKNGVLAGNRAMLARAITLVESQSEIHRSLADQLVSSLIQYSGKSVRIGITGSPGVGKSTFIDGFGDFLTKINKKIAVLAIDPSSKISGGSILGDKTRMEKLVSNQNAFVRPSPAGLELGGVAQRTFESVILCEAAGYDVILIETVGVGQSETSVKEMTDFLMFITIAGAGDELQGIKRGIMEMIDLVVINKSDQIKKESLNQLISNLTYALHLFPEKISKQNVPILTCSAINNVGFDKILEKINHFIINTKANGFFENNRQSQKLSWLKRSLEGKVFENVYSNPLLKTKIAEYELMVKNNEISPIEAANAVLKFSGLRNNLLLPIKLIKCL